MTLNKGACDVFSGLQQQTGIKDDKCLQVMMMEAMVAMLVNDMQSMRGKTQR